MYATNSAEGGDEGVIGDDSMLVQSGRSVEGGGEAGGTDTELSLRVMVEPKLWSGELLLPGRAETRLLSFMLSTFMSMLMVQPVLRDVGARSAKRISERAATRSREGRALDVLDVLDVEALEEALEGMRLSGFERVTDGRRGNLSVGSLGPSCGMDASGGGAGDVGVVIVILGLLEAPRGAGAFREFVALCNATLRSVWRLF